MSGLPSFITLLFILFISCLVLWDGISFWDQKGRNHRNLKGEMTGLGILGTFIGIFLGLWHFDTAAIQESIPPLLEGLKTAFITSIVGLTCAVFLTVAQTLAPSRYARTGDPVADKVNVMIQSLDETMTGVTDGQKAMTEEMSGLRSDLRGALDKISEGASDQLIAALNQVIKDFNQNLTEQFGENFKELNHACARMVEWQRDYLENIKVTTGALNSVKIALEAAMGGVAEHSKLAKELTAALVEGRTSIGAMKELMELMRQQSNGLADVIQKSEKAITSAEARAGQLAGKVEVVANQSGTHLATLVKIHETMLMEFEAFTRLIEKVLEAERELHELLKRDVELADSHIEKAHRKLEEALTSLTEHFGNSYGTYLEGLRRFTEHPEGRRGGA